MREQTCKQNAKSPQMLHSDSDIVMARLTPAGTAAIGVIGLAGHGAVALIASCIRTGGQKHPLRVPNTKLGVRHGPAGSSVQKTVSVGWFDDGRQSDQIVVVIQSGYDREIVEIHCHGGPAVIDWIMQALETKGARRVEVRDWLRLTIPNPIKRSVLARLGHAATFKTAAILLDQFHGAWERCVRQIQALLAEKRWSELRALVARLQGLIPVGKHLCRPFLIALAGAPNSGKSTLLNALLGYTRAITSPQPGTTRDVVTAETAFDGWPVCLLDTAGFRDTPDPLEAAGIAKAVHTWKQADLVLWLLDVSAPPILPPAELTNCLFVLSKIDLQPAWEADAVLSDRRDYVAVSAKTGAGMEELMCTILHKLLPQIPEPGEAVPFTDALCAKIENLHEAAGRCDWEQVSVLASQLHDPDPD